jgi:hypothetical protein
MVSAVAALALLAACGPSADGYEPVRTERGAPDAGPPDAGPLDTGPPDVPDEPLEDWDTTGAGPLSGIFASEVTVNASVVIDVESRQLYRIRLLQRGAEVRARVQPCRILLPSVPGVADLIIGPETEAVLRTKTFEAEGPFLSAPDPVGASYRPPSTVIVVGAELADPAADPLPTMEDPTTAIDEDADGNPGVTIDAETVLCREPEEAYVALRAAAALDGVVEDLDTIAGTVDPQLDFEILGFSDECLGAAAALDVMVRPGSAFRALRVGDAQDLDGNGNVSCTELAWFAPRLFGDHWL